MTPPSFRLRRAARHLNSGGLIVYPTEAVFGLGCDPLDPDAVARVLALKDRPVAKGLILVAASVNALEPYLAPFTDDMIDLVLPTWPGPTTWVLPASRLTPEWITGGRASVAVRVTAHPVAAALSRSAGGPIVSTSANRRGRPPSRTLTAARRAFGTSVDDYLGGGVDRRAAPTAIRDGTSGQLLRPGGP